MTYEIRNLTTGYQSSKAVHVVGRHITAQLQAGELTCLLGPNGAGKSTLLRTLAAFQPPLEGQLLLDGKPLEEFSSQQLATCIGIVLTERPDIKGMRVREMVAMGRSPYTGFWGRLSADDEVIVDQAMDQVGITALQRRMVHTLSDGERQKVMIAKALAQQTPIIFLDEPTAFLDFPSKVEMLLLLRRLAHEMQKTIFLSTHDLELALQTADRLWLMAKNVGALSSEADSLGGCSPNQNASGKSPQEGTAQQNNSQKGSSQDLQEGRTQKGSPQEDRTQKGSPQEGTAQENCSKENHLHAGSSEECNSKENGSHDNILSEDKVFCSNSSGSNSSDHSRPLTPSGELGLVIGTPRQLAADGSLPRFFSGPGLHFDAQHLRFTIEL
ncbi:MAG: ABC transporter ATP-binding protein [Bacteroidaceae bacterium]|nr:ABC transporter ATP-binding protein [Bacteroidaceae bacterium]